MLKEAGGRSRRNAGTGDGWMWLQKTALGEGQGAFAADDDVVEHTDVDETQRLTQTTGEGLVGA